MAHFYATVQGARGLASRTGTRNSGIQSDTASWQGAVHVSIKHLDGVDHAEVRLAPWHGNGVALEIYNGPVGGPGAGFDWSEDESDD